MYCYDWIVGTSAAVYREYESTCEWKRDEEDIVLVQDVELSDDDDDFDADNSDRDSDFRNSSPGSDHTEMYSKHWWWCEAQWLEIHIPTWEVWTDIISVQIFDMLRLLTQGASLHLYEFM